MPWYRTGTISVTNGSTAVTGAGTSWVSNAAIGEALLAPDGKVYEIGNIGSDTAITLGSAYLGATAGAQAYVILPSQSYIRDLAAQAAALVNGYASVYNGPGQGKFSDGAAGTPAISFSNDTNTGLYRSGADEVTLVANGTAIAKWSASGFSVLVGQSEFSGAIRSGSATATEGAVTLYSRYGTENVGVLGSMRSSGASMLGFCCQPSGATADTFTSTLTDNNFRSAVTFGETIDFWTGATQSVAVGSPVTMTKKLTLNNAGGATFNGTKPVAIDSTNGRIYAYASAGGWIMQYAFVGSAGTPLGGFGAHGASDELGYYFVGPVYNNPYIALFSTGRVAVGDIVDDGVSRLRVNGLSTATVVAGSRSGQVDYLTAAVQATSSSGDVMFALHAEGSSAVVIKHPRGLSKFQFKNMSDTAFVDVEALNGTFVGTKISIATATTPASATAPGTAGDIQWDANYIYVCVATNTWKRTAISTW